MEITLDRFFKGEEYSIGKLFINGKQVYNTMEDKDRGLSSEMPLHEIESKKVYGKTAIPTGRYEITMKVKSPKYSNFSRYKWAKKYGGYIPRLLDVKGFEGVLIHPGNTHQDTMGCILPGVNNVKGKVTGSVSAFMDIMDNYLLKADAAGEKIFITIK